MSRRWFGYLALVVAFAIVCSLLGMWQFARRAEARAEIARIDANYDAQAEPIAEVLPRLDSYQDQLKWKSVLLTGRYLPADELLVRNRPYGGNPGFEVLTPLRLDSGSVFIVDRGWVPTGDRQDAPDDVPAAPSGTVTVTARLRAGEPVLGNTASAGPGQVLTVNLPEIAQLVDGPIYTGAYGLIASEEPSPASAPLPSVRPERDEGPHLSYALQWFVFAILGFVGLGWALRQEYRQINAEDPEERERAEERLRRREARAPSDAETEDAILDSADR